MFDRHCKNLARDTNAFQITDLAIVFQLELDRLVFSRFRSFLMGLISSLVITEAHNGETNVLPNVNLDRRSC